jgi:flagellar biosynthesis anti-sigma factor FlgM
MTIERSHDSQDTGTGSAGAIMKVTNSTIHNGIKTSRSQERENRVDAGASSQTRAGRETDRVALSVSHEKIERLSNSVAALEGANAEKIESLKSRIAAGTYQVSGLEVAEKMLRSLGIQVSSGENE